MAVTVNQQLESRADLPSRYGETALVELVTAREITDLTSARRAILQGSIRRYVGANRVNELESDEVKEALRIYFAGSQFPAPAIVATQVAEAKGTLFLSGPADATAIEALGDGVSLTFAGEAISVDFDTEDTLAKVATALATALNAPDAFDGITVTAVGTSLLVEVPATIDVKDGFSIPSGAAAQLPLNAEDRIGQSPAFAEAETAVHTHSRIQNSTHDPRQIALIGNAIHTDITGGETRIERVSRYAGAAAQNGQIVHVLVRPSDNPGAATAGNLLFDLGQLPQDQTNHISAFFSADGTAKHVAYAAVFSAINFGLANQHRNGAGRDLFGVSADVIEPDLQAALTEQHANFFLRENNFTEVVNGTNISEWTDVIYVSSWLEREVANVVRQARKDAAALTIDAEGESVILAALNGLFERFDTGGFVQRNGQVDAEQRENIALLTDNDFAGTLPAGYLVLVGDASEADLPARKFAPVYYWVVYRASANDITINGFFQQ